MSRTWVIIGGLVGALFVAAARADNFQLTTGETMVGEVLPTTGNDQGVQIKVGEGDYKKVPWASFSQEDLRKFAKVPKLEPLVEPFIGVTQEEKLKKTEVNLKPPPHLERPAPQSLLGALFSSGLGLFVVLVLHAANVYAGYEVSIFRARPAALVCGVSAVLPIIGPILFLCLPVKTAGPQEVYASPPESTHEAAAAEAVNPMKASGAAHPTSLRLAPTTETEHAARTAKPAKPEATIYQRGQFTFNRRFFETKFPGFFGVVRRDADKDKVLVIKAARGEYVGERISRIAANDLHLQVERGEASEEVMIPFSEIQEIRLTQKDA